ncbi:MULTISPECIES: BMP family lipoprotein [Mesobacillus]|uniref:BMP family lipoprotein n=1 Tax=Mesobacillus TaxID=2675231 RepID=UPI001CE30A6B|nr:MULTISPECIES: BMP family ABC transporter substrate-binding protein [Mesobacillus]MCM3572711.1 BMP family ABC transporter substrate-binding protein [Mesobacillus subterraneus]UYZ23665.1 BMP family ABC transporter substrate-binding protein [Mesobacillus jeotgali]
MKKRKFGLVMSLLLAAGTMLAGCGSDDGGSTGGKESDLRVGMVTDAGTIDDKSFNQGTWEGILKAEEDLGVKTKYLKPAGTTEAEYLKEIGNLYDAEYKFIITPGFKFETAVFQAQDKYEDAKFVIIDGNPHNGDFNPVVKDNTVAVFFAEHESGFLAGVAAAVELKEGEAGFIGGMEIPAVQKFNWGFQQGLKYANENLDTNVTMKAENVVYQGSFDNAAAGGQIAAQFYDRGVDVIFTAAGGVGVGAINEAKNRAKAGENVWIVGVDVDQFEDGKYDGDKSVILTSAMKKLDQVAFDMVQAEIDGKFPGGETLTFDAKNDGIGLPEENPNLSEETMGKVKEAYDKIKSEEITVSAEQGDLFK